MLSCLPDGPQATLAGVLTTEQLLRAYASGIFPMALHRRGEVGWFSPDPRALIPLDDRFHVPHGLRRTLRKGQFETTFDVEFEAVIRACSMTHGETWISEEIVQSYCQLHRQGHAHSVETRLDGALAGGLYGVSLGGAFFGESMFHYESDASKVALVALVTRLRERQFLLLDTQWTTPHLAQFGAYVVPKREYLRLLQTALARPCVF
jgi:leucyl/phenylalanyl-tRNA--protein transferase